MNTQQVSLPFGRLAEADLSSLQALSPALVLVFGPVGLFEDARAVESLRLRFPDAVRIGCSTAGEIDPRGIQDDTALVTAVAFQGSRVVAAETEIAGMDDSADAGRRLAGGLPPDGLRHVLVLAPGVAVNGSALVRGLESALPPAITLSGGLAGDQGRFAGTEVLGPGGASPRHAVAVGLYGDGLDVRTGTFGGWKPFGPLRRVTRVEGNVLYALDGQPALTLYEQYLGDQAAGLPGAGLLFPFLMRETPDSPGGLIRTILGIDREAGALILAGEAVEGGYLQLMHAPRDALIEGAAKAAELALGEHPPAGGLALLVSCVGRRLALGGRADLEVDAVTERLSAAWTAAGFCSNGEIAPLLGVGDCHLHNQTMTITLIAERPA